MAKSSSVYVCSACGAEFPKWQGRCPECGEWNTIEETLAPSGNRPLQVKAAQGSASRGGRFAGFAGAQESGAVDLGSVPLTQIPRIHSGFGELDRVLGGGIVPGSVVLIGGNPGAGKSTLLLQMVSFLAANVKVLYVTGEESLQQVALRAGRLGLNTAKVRIATETGVDRIIFLCEKEEPQVLIIDSIQVMYMDGISSAPGSVSQVRESAAALTQFAKRKNISVFMIGHVTKEGSLAGPKILEHCVDCSLLLEGDRDSRFRTLRCQKNRFGAVNEIGVFAMVDKGLREIDNPSAIFLNRTEVVSPGSAVMVIWEGSRPLLMELQALVDSTQYGNPRRLTIGTEANRLAMLLAVLHRHGGVSMGDQDVFVNVVGGVKVEETSSDLPLVAALLSSYNSRALPRDMVIFGEIGLSGEIRPVQNGADRLTEAYKHGFKQAIVPRDNAPRKKIPGMTVYPVSSLSEVMSLI